MDVGRAKMLWKNKRSEKLVQEMEANESHFMGDTCTFTASLSQFLGLYVIHSILFFHLILFFRYRRRLLCFLLHLHFLFSCSNRIKMEWFVIGDERRFGHRQSAHSANHQYTYYECILDIDRFD